MKRIGIILILLALAPVTSLYAQKVDDLGPGDYVRVYYSQRASRSTFVYEGTVTSVRRDTLTILKDNAEIPLSVGQIERIERLEIPPGRAVKDLDSLSIGDRVRVEAYVFYIKNKIIPWSKPVEGIVVSNERDTLIIESNLLDIQATELRRFLLSSGLLGGLQVMGPALIHIPASHIHQLYLDRKRNLGLSTQSLPSINELRRALVRVEAPAVFEEQVTGYVHSIRRDTLILLRDAHVDKIPIAQVAHLEVLEQESERPRSVIQPGSRIRLTAPGLSSEPLMGSVYLLTGDTLYLYLTNTIENDGGDFPIPIRLSDARRIEVNRGMRSHRVAGFFGGLAFGLVAGIPISKSTQNEKAIEIDCIRGSLQEKCYAYATWSDALEIMWYSAGGALLGLVIGSTLNSERWERVTLQPSLGLSSPRINSGRADIGVTVTLRLSRGR